MANDFLKEMLIGIGFRVNESSYKRQVEAVDKVGKQLSKIDREDHERVTAEQRRHEVRKRNADGLVLALGGVTTAAAAAATVVAAAVAKMTGGFDQFHFISQRTGASVNNIKGLTYAFSQVGSTAESAVQALESFAKARRTNPGINAMLRGYGVDTRGDSADVLMRGIDAVQARHPYFAGAQVAELLGISEEQFETLSRYKKEIKEYREEIAKTQRALNVNSDESARAAATVQRAFGSLTATLGVLLEKLYSALAPTLERIAKGFKDWLAANPEKVEKVMRGISQAVEATAGFLGKLGDWLGSEENQKKLADFWDTFSKKVSETVKTLRDLIETLVKIAKYLGIDKSSDPIGTLAQRALGNQPQAAEGDNSHGTTYTPLLQRGWNAVKRAFGGDPGDMSGGRASRQRGENASGAKESYDFWRSKGLTHAQAAGLVGMEEGESNFNPRAVGDGGAAHGAFQHHPDRRAKILRGTGIDIDRASHREQLEAAHWELTQGPDVQARQAWAAVKRAATPGASAAAGVYKFERPADKAGEAARRGARANYWAEKFKEGAVTAAPVTPRSMPRMQMNPGGFNVNDYLNSQPMGATSTSTDNSKRVDMKGDTHVHITTSGDARTTADSFKRAASDVNAMRLRDVQTAIR